MPPSPVGPSSASVGDFEMDQILSTPTYFKSIQTKYFSNCKLQVNENRPHPLLARQPHINGLAKQNVSAGQWHSRLSSLIFQKQKRLEHGEEKQERRPFNHCTHILLLFPTFQN